MSRKEWSVTVTNRYLGKAKTIRGYAKKEVELQASILNEKWAREEQRQREQKAKQQAKEEAERIANANRHRAQISTEEATQLLKSYQNLLQNSIRTTHRIDWQNFKKQDDYHVPAPTLELARHMIGVPNANPISEFLFPTRKYARVSKEGQASELYEQLKAEHQSNRDLFFIEQQDYNECIEAERLAFERGDHEMIEKYVEKVLNTSVYPTGFRKGFVIQFDPQSNILGISFELPEKRSVPQVLEYKYNASKNTIEPVNMKPKDFDLMYEDCLYQICLRTIHEVFSSTPGAIKSVVFNGWAKTIDSRTGKEIHACIISCQAPREQFESFNLERVSPKECFRNLKGISAGPLSEMAPVRPIIALNKKDSRFIPPRDISSALGESTNLATMDWADFEHLVRQLFEKVFSKNGGEVHVTQASRDGGVDAIAFDPDPIRGGKFVIQAKRYNNVVPVSAARDLYGTMISEGAVKGILVTTSYYGNDSREFIKDKPITLIDGSNLVYMFQEHGYSVNIELQRKDR